MGKIKEVVQKAVDGVDKGLDVVSEKVRENAEKEVATEISLPERAKIEARSFEFNDIGSAIEEMSGRDNDLIDKEIQRIENIVFKHHLYNVEKEYAPVFSVERSSDKNYNLKKISYEKQIRGLLVKKFVFDKNEYYIDKLNNVFSSMMDLGSTLAMIIHRTKTECTIAFLIKSNAHKDSDKIADDSINTLKSAIWGNFPGSDCIIIPPNESPEIYSAIPELNNNCPDTLSDRRGFLSHFKKYEKSKEKDSEYELADFIDEIFCPTQANSVAIVSGIPSIKTQDTKYINQGLEKVLDGACPQRDDENYTIILLAEPLVPNDIANIRNGYESMATLLTPYQNFQCNQTRTVSLGKNLSETENLAKQVGTATNYSVGIGAHASASANASANASLNNSNNTGTATSHMEGKNKGSSDTFGGSVSNSSSLTAGTDLGPVKASASNTTTTSADYHHTSTRGTSESDTNTISNGFSKGYSAGGNAGAGASVGLSANVGMNKTINSGRTYSTGFSFGENYSEGQSVSETRTFTNISVSNIIERLNKEISRINSCESSGVWRFAGYVLSGSRAMAKQVAHMYQGVIQGEDSFAERNAVNTWSQGYYIDQNKNQKSDFNAIITSLLNLEHPVFVQKEEKDETYLPAQIYCATELNGAELALALSLPQKSVAGLPVLKCASFGREIQKLKYSSNTSDLTIGHVYHMLHEEKDISFNLDKNQLTAHTFVTGSTGSGKTNTVCKILESLYTDGVKFLVVEPAKGEYKDKFGWRSDVSVYGTNPKLTQMLRINPFSFPTESTHVLEHMDRLVEIFNVCWSMYAAMPAILKEAIERAYEEAGWDLVESKNQYGVSLFPSFSDICRHIEQVVAESAYSADNKSDYIGALVTRIRSLTNGLNGIIFSNDEISNEDLFEKNVIVDLSRVGSTETKSLIMGMLVLKLQEHRMDQGIPNNTSLKHITVLEEAHNLLKRTSTEQVRESSNLLGKSVEMLANSIAEMRAYGEGFVIADQSPGLLDMSVIRNTNTKIIMRLPDISDRELVGKAAGLNDDQIVELGKLETGVAAIMQSGWLEAVLCKVDEFDRKDYMYRKPDDASVNTVKNVLINCLLTKNLTHMFDRPDEQILKADIPVKVKIRLLNHKPQHNYVKKIACEIAYELLDGYKLSDALNQHFTADRKKQLMLQNIRKSIPAIKSEDLNRLMGYIFSWHYEITQSAEALNIAKQYIDIVK